MTAARERTYRGISERAALAYLEGLGAHRVNDQSVAGDGWRAAVSSTKVSIGPSLSLTEVTVRFQGDDEVLDSVIKAFSQKAIRAGG